MKAKKFKNKYRIASNRIPNWDYSKGAYFITLNCKNRVPYFGTIVNQEMQLSEIGKVVQDEWLKTPIVRPNMNLELGAFVVMPDHFHALIKIPPQENGSYSPNKFGSQSNNLGSIMRGFKSAVTMYARKNNIPFNWQANYHDSLIRGPRNWLIVTKYIKNNPKWWGRKKRRPSKATQ